MSRQVDLAGSENPTPDKILARKRTEQVAFSFFKQFVCRLVPKILGGVGDPQMTNFDPRLNFFFPHNTRPHLHLSLKTWICESPIGHKAQPFQHIMDKLVLSCRSVLAKRSADVSGAHLRRTDPELIEFPPCHVVMTCTY